MKKSKFVLLSLIFTVFLGFSLFFVPVNIHAAFGDVDEHWFLPDAAKNYVDIDGRGVRFYIDCVGYYFPSDPYSSALFYPVRDYDFDDGTNLRANYYEYMEIGIFDQELISLIDYYYNTYGTDSVPENDRVYIYWDVDEQLFKLEYHGTLLGYMTYRIERLKDVIQSEYYRGYKNGFYLGNELGVEAGYDIGFRDGRTNGYNEGHEVGYTEGYDVGYNEGHNIGYTEGYDEGLKENNLVVYDKGYDKGYIEGHDVGYDEGLDVGYNEGREGGYSEGYDVGYIEGHDVGYTEGFDVGYNEAYPKKIILLITLILFILSVFIYFKFKLKWVLLATILLWFVPIFLVDNIFVKIFSVIMIIATITITFFNEREEEF